MKPIIGITAGTIWGNRGAEAMLATTIGKLSEEFPEARFKVFSYYPEEDSALVRNESVSVYDLTPIRLALLHTPLAVLKGFLALFSLPLPDRVCTTTVNAFSECHIVIDIGGITFSDGREPYLLYNVFSLAPCFALKIPIVKLAQAMGPFQNPINRFFSKAVLASCKKLFARGRQTATYLTDLGIADELWQQAPDVAFAYDPMFSLSQENPKKVAALKVEFERQDADARQQRIAIIPSSLVDKKTQQVNENYCEFLCELTKNCLKKGWEVVFLPNATRESFEGGRNNDLYVIRKVQNSLSSSLKEPDLRRVTYVDFDVNTHAIRDLLSYCSLLVTSRFHGLIAGLSLEIPTAVIGWGHKYREVLEDFNLENFSFDLTASSQLPLDQFIDQQQELAIRIKNILPKVKEKCDAQFKVVAEVIREIDSSSE